MLTSLSALLLFGCAEACAEEAAGAQDRQATFEKSIAPWIKTYCQDCHGGDAPEASLELSAYTDAASLLRDRATWEKVLVRVSGGTMPPADAPLPTSTEREQLSAAIASLLKADCSSARYPGRVTCRRLNRAEYNNTVRDLLMVDFQPAQDFPADDVGAGFDNIGDVLSLSPVLFEKYFTAAEEIATAAIGARPLADRVTKVVEAESIPYEGGVNRSEGQGLLFSSNGRAATDLQFAEAGEYWVSFRVYGDQAGDELPKLAITWADQERLEFEVTGTQTELQSIPMRLFFPAGSVSLQIEFLNDFYDPGASDPARRDRNLFVDFLEITGPLQPNEGSLPRGHRRIIHQQPTAANYVETAAETIKRFGGKAYRRPLTEEEQARYLELFHASTAEGASFEDGIRVVVQAMLVSPYFLFRMEGDPAPGTPVKELNDFELAARLSYFLWSSCPDDELTLLAEQGSLHEPQVLQRQVRRMLTDAKSKALVDNFVTQWLQIRNLEIVEPDLQLFPQFDDGLRQAMWQETTRFAEHVFREDRPILDFLTADYTFVNEVLAKHYGIPGVSGPEMRQVTVPADVIRGGVLTQGSILTVTSNPTRTSPVKRGRWILEQILGEPPPAPPAGVPPLADKAAVEGATLRQRMEQHRKDPNCAVCHLQMDALGFGFENYDAVGHWRTQDSGAGIDPAGELPGGLQFQGPAELRQILGGKQDLFARCFAEKLLTYALGRSLEYYDACAVDDVVTAARGQEYRFSSVVLEIVMTDAFRKQAVTREFEQANSK